MPRKKRETFLQRQRRKLKTEKAIKASNKQLPSKGGSSSGSTKARVQRGMTRDKMAKDQVVNFGRALKRMLKQSAAQAKLNKAAKGTKGQGVRTAGAGGGLAKRPSSALARRTAPKGGPLTKSTGGGLKSKGGALVKRNSSPTKSDVQKVKVKDLGTTKGGSTRTGQPAANRSRLPARKGGALVKSTKGALKAGAKGGGPGLGGLLSALQIGAAVGEAYKNTNRAPAKSGRGAGRATFNPKGGAKPKTGGAKPKVKPGEKYGPPAPKNKGTIGGLIKPTTTQRDKDTRKDSQRDKDTRKPTAPQRGTSNRKSAARKAPQPNHGAYSSKIKELMAEWKKASGAEKDRIGRQIHRLKYEKTSRGLKIRTEKNLSSAGEVGWKGRSKMR